MFTILEYVLKWEELFVAFASNRALDASNNKTNMYSNWCAKIPNKTQSEFRDIVNIKNKTRELWRQTQCLLVA